MDSDFELAFTRVGRSRRALVAVFTDLVDEAAARSLTAGDPDALPPPHRARRRRVRDPALGAGGRRTDELAPRARGRAGGAGRARARDRATAQVLRGPAPVVVEAPAEQLPERCLDAYLRAKTRGCGS